MCQFHCQIASHDTSLLALQMAEETGVVKVAKTCTEMKTKLRAVVITLAHLEYEW